MPLLVLMLVPIEFRVYLFYCTGHLRLGPSDLFHHTVRVIKNVTITENRQWRVNDYSTTVNPLNANDANRIRKRVSANDAFRRHTLARAIRVVFLYLWASERNVTLGAPVAVIGPSHSYLIVSSGRTRGAQSSAALCAKFHAVLLD